MERQQITHRRIRKLWKAAWILQGVYLLLGILVNVWQQPFLHLFMVMDVQGVKDFTLWPQIACVLGTGAVFLVLDGLLFLRLKEQEKLTRAAPEEARQLGYRTITWLLGTGSFLVLWLFPQMASRAVREDALYSLVDSSVDTVTYSAITTLNGQGVALSLLLMPAVVLLFCGLSLLWNGTNTKK